MRRCLDYGRQSRAHRPRAGLGHSDRGRPAAGLQSLAPDQLAESDDAGHAVRSEVIRDLLLGRHGDRLDPRGLQVAGARIAGQLDLADLHSPIALALNRCWLEQVLVAVNAHLPSLWLTGSHTPALLADRLRVDSDVFLRDGFTASTATELGVVRLLNTHIGGALNCSDATLTNTTGPALNANRMQVEASLFLRDRFTASAPIDKFVQQLEELT